MARLTNEMNFMLEIELFQKKDVVYHQIRITDFVVIMILVYITETMRKIQIIDV